MAAPAYRAASAGLLGNGSGNLTTTITLGKPTGTADGDYLVAILNIPGNFYSVTGVPSGWTLLFDSGDMAGGGHVRIYGKQASGEGASWTWTLSTQVAFYACVAAAISGAKVGTPTEGLSSTQASGQTNGSNLTRSVTTGGPDRLVVTIATGRCPNAPIPTFSWDVGTEQFDFGGSGPGLPIALDTIVKSAAGSQSVTATVSQSTATTTDLTLTQLAVIPAQVDKTIAAVAAVATASRGTPIKVGTVVAPARNATASRSAPTLQITAVRAFSVPAVATARAPAPTLLGVRPLLAMPAALSAGLTMPEAQSAGLTMPEAP